jgi:ATP-dependent DNA helicase DinG
METNLFPIIGQEPLPAVTEEVEISVPAAVCTNPVLQTNRAANIVEHFPFPTIREAQSQALATVVESRKLDKKFTLIEAPTGVGKSGIAMATASWAKTQETPIDFQPGAYVLSTQKTLTQQYMRDFEKDGLLELKGRSNYWCNSHSTNCSDAAHLQGDDPEENCSKMGICPYSNAKRHFMESPVGVTNFSYYLTETMYAGMLKPRNYLVLDECHNVENQILGFTDTLFTQEKAAELEIKLPLLIPGDSKNLATALKWFEEIATPKMADYIRDLEAQMGQADDRAEKIALAKKFTAWQNFKMRTDMFCTTDKPQDWIAFSDVKMNRDGEIYGGTRNLVIKPLTATLFAEQLMFRKAANIVMMSATILDFKTFMRNLGIDPAMANTMAVPSEFPLENRPIFYKPIANMGYRTKKQALPLIVKAIFDLTTKKYANKKGIIHAQSYENLLAIKEYFQANGQGHRLITHTSLPGSREEAVARHCSSPEPTVILSPSMTEGLDLKGDLSRFQIIPKVPYPALDPYTKARMDRDGDWYQWQTALTLIQATGRSVRSKTDHAATWILDEGFTQFISKNESKLPKWWTDSIEFR